MSGLTFLLVLAALPVQDESTLRKLGKEIADVARRVQPSVVLVRVVKADDDLLLSGVVYSKQGHIVTDASAIDGAEGIAVLEGQRTMTARRIDVDRRTGVAVIKVDADGLVPADFAPEGCTTGATAVLVGNALGHRGTAVFGTVGGAGRSVLVAGRKIENLLQLNLPVNPGDCGAAVADSAGRLLGLVHAAGPAEGPRDPGAASCFAVSAAWVRFSADRIIKHGRIVRGWMGASLLPLPEATRLQLGLPAGRGAEVVRIERESPARKAGLLARDVLVEFDGRPIDDLDALQWKVAAFENPVRVKLSCVRNGERREFELEIQIDPQN